MRLKTIYTALFMLALLSACGGQGQTLPTQVVMPTDPPTQIAAAFSVTPSPTPTLGVTVSPTPEDANVPTLTSIALTADALTNPPPASLTADPNITPTITLTPSKTITDTITPTFTPEPTEVQPLSPLEELVLTALVSTVLPPTYIGIPGGIGTPTLWTPTPFVPTLTTCSFPPTGGFATFFNTNTTLRQQLGCPLGSFNVVRPGASQVFQQGLMVWASGTPNYIYVIYSNATYQRFADTFNEATDPVSGGEIPPAPNLLEPVRGFGKVWRDNPAVRTGLGWAAAAEQGGTATSLDFERGLMLHISTRGEIYALVGLDSGSWQVLFGNP